MNRIFSWISLQLFLILDQFALTRSDQIEESGGPNTVSSFLFDQEALILINSTNLAHQQSPSSFVANNSRINVSLETQEGESKSAMDRSQYPECGVYLAPSSIENAGFGLYAGKDYGANHIVTEGLGIPMIDYRGHNGHRGRFSDLLGEYGWCCQSSLCDFEAYNIQTLNTNVGAFANYHPYEANIAVPILRFRDSIVDHHSPGRGAFTYYDISYKSSAEIKKGAELFLDYGDDWASSRREYENFPITEDYHEAESIIDSLMNDPYYINNNSDGKENMIMRARQELDDDEIATKTLIPDSVDDFEYLFYNGMTSLSLKDRQRSMNWLDDNGICLDNVRSGPSTIRDAGRGAFAARLMKKGSVIAPMPLLQVDKAYFDMYKSAPDRNGDPTRVGDRVLGNQLMINYCFGHDETTMLLCSFTSANLINHGRCSGDGNSCKFGPNAAYRWASWDSTDEWLEMPVKKLLMKKKRGLSLEIVALRDINPGEEILFDYGEAWDIAWKEHSQSWTSPSNLDFEQVSDMLSNLSWDSNSIRTSAELKDRPYPENIATACYYWEEETIDHAHINVTMRSMDSPNEAIVKRLIDGSSFFPIQDDERPNANYWPCTVYKRNDDGVSFTVRIFAHHEYDSSWTKAGVALFLVNFPRESIHFVHKPYTSDQHLSSSFRRPIGLMNDMVPPNWRNFNAQ